MKYTNRLQLKKPEGTDPVKIEDINANMDKIDESLAGYPGFIIAPADAVNKERADLVLTGVPADDALAINQAITDLHTARESAGIVIRIDFLGGTIDLEYGQQILIQYNNFRIYGNGVKITSSGSGQDTEGVIHITGNNVTLDGFDVYCVYIDGPAVSNEGNNCYIMNNTVESEYNIGLSNMGDNCYFFNNKFTSTYSIENSFSNYGFDCIIIGNDTGTAGFVTSSYTYPNTIELLEQLNLGSVGIFE